MEIEKRKGFTLIELLMAMSMTAIMIGVVLSSLSGSKINREIDGEAGKILGALREVQNYSLTGKGLSGTVACNRFSVKVVGNNFAVYYSDRSSGTCTVVGSPATYTTRNGVSLAAFAPGGGVLSSLDFTIPNGRVFVNGAVADLSSGAVRFELSKNGMTDNVCVYPFGRIEQKAVGAGC